jgi:hypothetical protein
LRSLVPSLRIGLQAIDETGVGARRFRKPPPDPVGRERRRQGGDDPLERRGGVPGRRPRRDQPRRDREVVAHRDEEHARPRLRQEQRGVDRQRAEPIAEALQRRGDGGKIRPALRGQGPADIFERDESWRAGVGPEAVDQGAKTPEGARPLAVEPRSGAGERQVLAGKGRPGEVGCAGQVALRQQGDVGDGETVGAPVGGVGRPFARIDVVGEQRPPRRPEARARHAAAAEEFVEGVLRHD